MDAPGSKGPGAFSLRGGRRAQRVAKFGAMAAPIDILKQAHSLATQGREAEAVALVERGIADGNPFALFMLGDWRLRGTMGPRDMPEARELFRRAAEAGLPTAKLFYTNFLAGGMGGDVDWPVAMRRLETEAQSDPRRNAALRLIQQMDLDERGQPKALPAAEQLCKSPDVRFFPNLFSAAECTYLAALAEPEFKPSTVTPKLGAPEYRDAARDSAGSTLHWFVADPAVHALKARVAAATGTAIAQGEHLHILRYGVGQQFRPHFDWSEGIDNQRIQTALIYLNEAYEGGETYFPEPDLRVSGRTGDAVIFRNASDDGVPDPRALHAGLPVTKGVKLIASYWIRQLPYEGD
jgi:prolyl 4-hydroxylase